MGPPPPQLLAPALAPRECALLARCRQGDDEAFRVLWGRHEAEARSLVHGLLRKYHLEYMTDDALAEATLTISMHLAQLRAGTDPWPYWKQMIVNCAKRERDRALDPAADVQERDSRPPRKDVTRPQSGKRRPKSVVGISLDAILAAGSDPTHCSHHQETEDIVEWHDLYLEFLRCVRLLPWHQRVALLLHLRGFKNPAIAHRLDVPVGTIKQRLSRGKEALRNLPAFQAWCRDIGYVPAA